MRTKVYYSVASLRLRDELAEQRELAEASNNQATDRLTFADVIEGYRRRIRAASETSFAPLPALYLRFIPHLERQGELAFLRNEAGKNGMPFEQNETALN